MEINERSGNYFAKIFFSCPRKFFITKKKKKNGEEEEKVFTHYDNL